jgi:hypothetical protein
MPGDDMGHRKGDGAGEGLGRRVHCGRLPDSAVRIGPLDGYAEDDVGGGTGDLVETGAGEATGKGRGGLPSSFSCAMAAVQ